MFVDKASWPCSMVEGPVLASSSGSAKVSEVYSKPYQKSKIDIFAKIVNG